MNRVNKQKVSTFGKQENETQPSGGTLQIVDGQLNRLLVCPCRSFLAPKGSSLSSCTIERPTERALDMTFCDLRMFLGAVDERGDLKKINGAHWELEIGTLSELLIERPDHPAPTF